MVKIIREFDKVICIYFIWEWILNSDDVIYSIKYSKDIKSNEPNDKWFIL